MLRDIHALRSRRFHAGDYAASDLLIDVESAIEQAELTERQRTAIELIYERDLRQADAAYRMEITQQAVQQHVAGALKRIAGVFERWDYGEVIAVVGGENDGEETEGCG